MTISFQILKETEKAYNASIVVIDKSETYRRIVMWLPKSQVVNYNSTNGRADVPGWLGNKIADEARKAYDLPRIYSAEQILNS